MIHVGWNIVIRECNSLAAKWQQLGGYLGLPIGLIDSIKGNYPNDNSACWSEALKQWIQQNYNTARFGLPSWRTLLEAIARENRLLFKALADSHQAPGKLTIQVWNVQWSSRGGSGGCSGGWNTPICPGHKAHVNV